MASLLAWPACPLIVLVPSIRRFSRVLAAACLAEAVLCYCQRLGYTSCRPLRPGVAWRAAILVLLNRHLA